MNTNIRLQRSASRQPRKSLPFWSSPFGRRVAGSPEWRLEGKESCPLYSQCSRENGWSSLMGPAVEQPCGTYTALGLLPVLLNKDGTNATPLQPTKIKIRRTAKQVVNGSNKTKICRHPATCPVESTASAKHQDNFCGTSAKEKRERGKLNWTTFITSSISVIFAWSFPRLLPTDANVCCVDLLCTSLATTAFFSSISLMYLARYAGIHCSYKTRDVSNSTNAKTKLNKPH